MIIIGVFPLEMTRYLHFVSIGINLLPPVNLIYFYPLLFNFLRYFVGLIF